MDVSKSSTTLAIQLDGSDESEVINLAKQFLAGNLTPVAALCGFRGFDTLTAMTVWGNQPADISLTRRR